MYLYFSWGVMFMMMSIATMTLGLQFMASGETLMVDFTILENPCPDFGLCLVMDWMSFLLLSVVFLISSLVLIYSTSYMGENEVDTKRFVSLVVLFIVSMGLLIVSPSLFFALLGWDGLGLVSFGLVIFYQNQYPLSAGLLTVYTNRLGDVALLLCLVFLWESGSFLSDSLSISGGLAAPCLLFLGAITSSAQLPFSSWLPAAMAAPTPVSSLVHSSTLVTAGIYLMIRFSNIFVFLSMWTGMLGLMTMIMAGLVACVEMDLKSVIAMSTLSQLGVMLFSLSLSASGLAFFHLITHALFKSMLFLGCGSLISLSWGNQDSRFYGSFSPSSPLVKIMMTVGSLALTGFPFLAGFYSKDMILESSLSSSFVALILFSFLGGCILTVAYGFNLLLLAFMGGSLMSPLSPRSETIFMSSSMLMLMFLSITMGGMMSWYVSSEMFVPYFSFSESFLGGFLFLCGSSMFLASSMIPKFLSSSMAEMGYLKWFTTHFLSGGMGITSNFKGDFTWGELMGGQGLWLSVKSISSSSNYYDIQNFRLLMTTVSLWALFTTSIWS